MVMMAASSTREAEIRQRIERSITAGARRFGYLVAALLNAVLLWCAHQLLDWEWPGFLTPRFDDVLPIVTASFVAGIVANLVYAVFDGWPVKPIGEIVTACFGVAVGLRVWRVFPFDFGDGTDWSWLARLIIVVVIVGSALGAVTQSVKLARGPAGESEEAPT